MHMKVGVMGLGKAGLPLAAVIADAGIEVIGIDLDKNKVEMINKGLNPIKEEPELSELVKKYGGKSLMATANLDGIKQCNIYVVIVPLFINENKKPDLSIIINAFENVGKVLKKNDLVVLETTVPVKTTETLIRGILEKNSGLKAGTDFYLAYSPERIMTGYSISRFKEFPKLVGGINKESTDMAFEFYKKFAKPVKASNSRTAELAKIAEGVYRDVNIALANELFKVSEKYGIDFWEMKEAAKHQYCNILEPGNVSGHCIPVYPWFLISNMDVPLIKSARELNDSMLDYYFKKIRETADKNNEDGTKKIGIVGLSYREGVKEKSFSRSVDLISLLKKNGYEVYGLDPLYTKEETEKEFGINYLGDFEKMDAVIVMNKELQYRDRLNKIKNKVIDVKSILS